MNNSKISVTSSYLEYLFNKYNIKDHDYEVFEYDKFEGGQLEHYNYIPKNKNYILVKHLNDTYKLYQVISSTSYYLTTQANYKLIEEFVCDTKKTDNIKKNALNNYLVHLCSLDNKIEEISMILDNDLCDVNCVCNDTKLTPLIMAIHNQKNDIAKLLIEKYNANVNKPGGPNDSTPLMYTAENNMLELTTILLKKYCINVNATNSDGLSALHYAAFKNCAEVLKLLIEENININARSYCGFTPLSLTTSMAHVESAKILLEAENIDVNLVDNNGYTPLMSSAIVQKRFPILKLLLKHPEVNIIAKDNNGLTALDYAKYNEAKEILTKYIEK